MRAPLPANENARLAALSRYDVLDSAPEQIFDELTTLAAYICGTPIAAFSLVDENRQWFKSITGLAIRETARDLAFCAHTILGESIFEVPDATSDIRFSDNALVTEDPSIRFYAGAPLRTPDGFNLGSLCVIDVLPRAGLSAAQREALEVLSHQASMMLELRRTSADLAAALRDVHALSTILPICSHCRRYRDGDQHWMSAEEAIEASGTKLSHALCPDCVRLHYPDYADILPK